MKKLILLLSFLICQLGAQAQKNITISGIITDSVTRQPLGGVAISYLVGDPEKELEPAPEPSNSSGFFSIPLENVDKGTPVFIYFAQSGYTYRSPVGQIYHEHTTSKVAIKNFLGEIRMAPLAKHPVEEEKEDGLKTIYIRLVKEKTAQPVMKNVNLFYFTGLSSETESSLIRTIVPIKEGIPGLFELSIDSEEYPNIRLITQSKQFEEYNRQHNTDQSYITIALQNKEPLKSFWYALGSTGLAATVGLSTNIVTNNAYARSKRKENLAWQQDLDQATRNRKISTLSSGGAIAGAGLTVVLYFERRKKIKENRRLRQLSH